MAGERLRPTMINRCWNLFANGDSKWFAVNAETPAGKSSQPAGLSPHTTKAYPRLKSFIDKFTL